MRLTRVEIAGYRRLVKASTNIDGRITAFVGSNEAGKTSIFSALVWLSNGGPLEVVAQSRGKRPAPGQQVVRAYFALAPDDLATVTDLELEEEPRSIVRFRTTEGTLGHEVQPIPRRPTKPFDDAAKRLARAAHRFEGKLGNESEDDDGPEQWFAHVRDALAEPDSDWGQEWIDAATDLEAWLREVAPGRAKKPRDAGLADALSQVRDLVMHPHPRGETVARLSARVPDFVVFSEENRTLETVHEMSLDQLRQDPPPALRDLLRIAGVTLAELWQHTANGDTSSRESLLEVGNARLLEFFGQAWNQSNVSVRLNTNSSRLELLVKELRQSGPVTQVSERSDGLRIFIALAAFLASGGWKVPPVLLIDEAETHLHFDAQADLVGVLFKSIDAEQILYTTHSPGCLPSDLGTGIRLVTRDPEDAGASVIKSNFWAGQEPGFAPLLFAMGAGAAAFSVCRRAVVCEGPTEMILLPQLLRTANRLDDLDYQIAPGLSNVRGFGLDVEEIAAKVVYLADGDSGGDELAARLLREGVAQERVFQLPSGCALEDLIRVEDYVNAINGLLTEMGQPLRVSASDLQGELTIAKSLEVWAKHVGARLPGKPEIAYALLRGPTLRLTPSARTALQRLHRQFLRAFEAPVASRPGQPHPEHRHSRRS